MAEKGEKRSSTGHRTPSQVKRHGRTYQATPGQKKNRAKRNAARAKLAKDGRVHKGDGKDVAHTRALAKGGSNAKGNLKVQSRAKNRGHGASPGGKTGRKR